VAAGDFDSNGALDPGEPGLPGVTVNVKDLTSAATTPVTTDAQGYWRAQTDNRHRYEIDVVLPPDRGGEPVGARNPALLYGLGNLVENAVDFAKSRVEVAVRWSAKQVAITIADDGPGFSTEIMDRIGEPYVTTRGVQSTSTDTDPIGLGLGFFIAKTLLERSGATLALANRARPETGAVVRVRWDRPDFERPAARLEDLAAS